MPCPQRGSKILSFRAGAKLHAEVFQAARILGTSPTEMMRRAMKEITADVLDRRVGIPAPILLASTKPRFPTNPEIAARRQIGRSDLPHGRALLRDKATELSLPALPQLVTESAYRTPAWQPGDPKPEKFGRR